MPDWQNIDPVNFCFLVVLKNGNMEQKLFPHKIYVQLFFPLQLKTIHTKPHHVVLRISDETVVPSGNHPVNYTRLLDSVQLPPLVCD